MPTFVKPAPAGIVDFSVRLVITDGPAPTVDIGVTLTSVDAGGAPIQRLSGDLRPELTALQQAQLEALALALFARAKSVLLA